MTFYEKYCEKFQHGLTGKFDSDNINYIIDCFKEGTATRADVIEIYKNDMALRSIFIVPGKAIELIKEYLQNNNLQNILICEGDNAIIFNELVDYTDKITAIDDGSDLIKLCKLVFPDIKFRQKFNFVSKEKYGLIVSFKRQNTFGLLLEYMRYKLVKNGTALFLFQRSYLGKTENEFANELCKYFSIDYIAELPELIIYFNILYWNIETTGPTLIKIDNKSQTGLIKIRNFEYGNGTELIIEQSNLGNKWVSKYYEHEYIEFEKKLKAKGYKLLSSMIKEIIKGIRFIATSRHYIREYNGMRILFTSDIQKGWPNNKSTSKLKSEFISNEGKNENPISRKLLIPKLWPGTYTELKAKFSDEYRIDKCVLKDGDIVFSIKNAEFDILRYKRQYPGAIISDELVLIRSDSNDELYKLFSSDQVKNIFKTLLFDRLNFKDIDEVDIENIPIPVDGVSNMSLEEIKDIMQSVLRTNSQTQEIVKRNDYLKSINENLEKLDIKAEKQIIALNKIDQNIEKILNNVNSLFDTIKNSNADINNKLNKFYEGIDLNVKLLQAKNSDDYDRIEKIVIEKFDKQWSKLEELSKSYLPAAEFLAHQISLHTSMDWSPVIIQLCRALENEIFQKIFNKYLNHLIAEEKLFEIDLNKKPDEDGLLGIVDDKFKLKFNLDFELKENKSPLHPNGYKLAANIVSNVKYSPIEDQFKWKIELGTMGTTLEYLTGNQVKSSPILIDFSKFIQEYFEENVLEKAFLKEIVKIAKNIRNKAAHPNYFNTEDAKNAQVVVFEVLRKFIGLYTRV